MVYVAGEEMTRYTMDLILSVGSSRTSTRPRGSSSTCAPRTGTTQRIRSSATSSPRARGSSHLQGARSPPPRTRSRGSGSRRRGDRPTAPMRRGWNGITISRDTIHIDGVELGYKKPSSSSVTPSGRAPAAQDRRQGKLTTTFVPEAGGEIGGRPQDHGRSQRRGRVPQPAG